MSVTSPSAPQVSQEGTPLRLGDIVPAVIFGISMLVAYGYEIFSFNLTIDEDIIAASDHSQRFVGSIGEGRWAMSALSLILPNPVTPGVSTGIAVAGSAVAWWLLSRRVLGLSGWQSLFAATLAGTVPTLAFIFSFSTIAFAIGIGNLFLVGFIVGLRSMSWWYRAVGVVCGAAATGVYDTFGLALAVLGLALVWQRGTWRSLSLAVVGTGLSFGLSRLIVTVEGLVLNVPKTSYIGAFFDLPGLVAHPLQRLRRSFGDFWKVISLSGENFGLHSPWLAVVFVLLFACAILSIVVAPGGPIKRILKAVALLGLIALPIAAEAISSVIPLRSMLYLPMVILVLFAMSIDGFVWLRAHLPRITPALLRTASAGLLILAILGNAVIINRLFSTSATTYALDRDLAFDIGQNKDRLLAGNNLATPAAVVIGAHTWPGGSFTEAKETFGGSLFNLNATRTVTFLRAHGISVVYPTEAQTEAITKLAASLPVYPQPGWVSLQGDVLVVNFGLPK